MGSSDGCSMGDLKTRKSCAKSKAKDLLLQEKTQKSNARKRETKIKTLEKEEKTRQRERKTKEKEVPVHTEQTHVVHGVAYAQAPAVAHVATPAVAHVAYGHAAGHVAAAH